MSYDRMDHVDWVERSIAAVKKRKLYAADRKRLAERKGWHAAPDRLNPFQRQVFTILGVVGGGIYNAPISWDSVEWSGRYVSLVWLGGLATFDFMALTNLVFLAHDARIRCDVGAKARHYLSLSFWPRAGQGSLSRRHPSLEEAVAAHRERFAGDHPVMFWRRVSETLCDVPEGRSVLEPTGAERQAPECPQRSEGANGEEKSCP